MKRSYFHILILILAMSCSTAQRRPASLDKTIVLSDIEGDWDKFVTWIEESQAFEGEPPSQIRLKEGHHFVFMGDAVDRGVGDIRILETLLNLKEANPEKINFILGNHDLSKLRILSELSNEAMEDIPPSMHPWIKGQMSKGRRIPARPISESQFQNALPNYNTKYYRLKWILETMGAGEALENRKKELEILLGVEVDSEKAIQSFIDDISPGGLMHRYLKAADLAAEVNGDLFVHGAITDENIGRVPGNTDEMVDLNEWIKELNAWAQNNIDSWVNNGKAQEDLLQYFTPIRGEGANQTSVLFARFFNRNGKIKPPSIETVKKLSAFFQRVVVGHTPVGNLPLIFTSEGVDFVMADTSTNKKAVRLELFPDRIETGTTLPNFEKIEAVRPRGINTLKFDEKIPLYEDSEGRVISAELRGSDRGVFVKYHFSDDSLSPDLKGKNCGELMRAGL